MIPTNSLGAEQGKESSNIFFSMGGIKYNSKLFFYYFILLHYFHIGKVYYSSCVITY